MEVAIGGPDRPASSAALHLAAMVASLSILTSCESTRPCGPGTVDSVDGCVPDDTTLEPVVQSVEVTSLSLDTEGQPLYLLYPVKVAGSLAIVGEELSRTLGGLAWLWGITVWSGARAVLHHGSAGQKERYLPAVAAGDLRFAFAMPRMSRPAAQAESA